MGLHPILQVQVPQWDPIWAQRGLFVDASGPHQLRTKFRFGGPTGDYIGLWEGPTKGYTTNLVQGSQMYTVSGLVL